MRFLLLGLVTAAAVAIWVTDDISGPITFGQAGVLVCITAIVAYFIWVEIDKRKQESLRKQIEED